MGDVIAGILGLLFGIVLFVAGVQGWGIFMMLFSVILMLKPIWAKDKKETSCREHIPYHKVIIAEKTLSINDFLEISSENGIIKAIVKQRALMAYGMNFGFLSGVIEKGYPIVSVPAERILKDKHEELTYVSPERGVLKKYVELKQFSYQTHLTVGMLLFELNTNEGFIQQYEVEREKKRELEIIERLREEEEIKAARIEHEKQQIAIKLKEKERRRKLEKQVLQELIDNGEIMPAAGRAPIPREVADAVYNRDGGRCVYCGSTENLQIDHIIPFSKGGADTLENFQILCQRCNVEKSNKIG